MTSTCARNLPQHFNGCTCVSRPAGSAGAENAGGPLDPRRPAGVDEDWWARLESHQRRDLDESGFVTAQDAYGDPVELIPGIVDDNADWAFKRGQCLALAVAMSEQTGCEVLIQRVDFGDTDENGDPFYNLGHAYLRLPEGELLDIQGVHDEEMALTDEFGIELDEATPIEPMIFPAERAREALAHFEGYIVEQDLTVAESFAARTLAEYRLGMFTGELDYDALGPGDARALLDPDLRRRYTAGDCGVLAHHLAEQNGWGVAFVGSYEEEEYDDHTFYGTEQLVHAYAVRPDGKLVDVTGVHEPEAAERLAAQWGTGLHTYPDAASADKVWDHEQ